MPITAPNTSAVGAGGGAVFVASGLDTRFAAASAPAPVNLTAQGKTGPWLAPGSRLWRPTRPAAAVATRQAPGRAWSAPRYSGRFFWRTIRYARTMTRIFYSKSDADEHRTTVPTWKYPVTPFDMRPAGIGEELAAAALPLYLNIFAAGHHLRITCAKDGPHYYLHHPAYRANLEP
ncbi:hypothetical protein EDB89DRAFT_2072387 [Lactarius sanguifluus]|nr:hypothetical protein EDB89DRAFT_2072387 [Lactarius sanguifluus]